MTEVVISSDSGSRSSSSSSLTQYNIEVLSNYSNEIPWAMARAYDVTLDFSGISRYAINTISMCLRLVAKWALMGVLTADFYNMQEIRLLFVSIIAFDLNFTILSIIPSVKHT